MEQLCHGKGNSGPGKAQGCSLLNLLCVQPIGGPGGAIRAARAN